MTEEVRYRLRGLSSEQFKRRSVGDEITLTIRGHIVADLEQELAHEGIQRVQTIKVDRMVEGISERVNTDADGQGTLDYESGADGQYSETYGTGQPVASTPAPDDRPEEPVEPETEGDEPSDAAPDEPEPEDTATVHEFPTFSSGDAS